MGISTDVLTTVLNIHPRVTITEGRVLLRAAWGRGGSFFLHLSAYAKWEGRAPGHLNRIVELQDLQAV